MSQILIVGAGITGCTLARQCAESGKNVYLIDSRNHIGGNCYDYINNVGIRVCAYGPHFFHTNSELVWKYVNRFSDWIPYRLKVKSNVHNILVPIPVNINTVNILFNTKISTIQEMIDWLETERTIIKEPKNSEDVVLNKCGHRLHNLLFKNYTKKQWDKDASELEPSVLSRIPLHTSFEDTYFNDIYQGLPKDGYTQLFKNMIDHPLIHFESNIDYFSIKHAINPEKTFYTGRIDTYFNLEPLEYRSLEFKFENIHVGKENYYQENIMINYPDSEIPYTRIVDYKHLPYNANAEYTTIVKEFPTWNGNPYYPVPSKQNRDLYAKYQILALQEKNVIFSGRLATYKYYNMDHISEDYWLSLRANNKVDVSEICKKYGGGGHKNASGCSTKIHPSILFS